MHHIFLERDIKSYDDKIQPISHAGRYRRTLNSKIKLENQRVRQQNVNYHSCSLHKHSYVEDIHTLEIPSDCFELGHCEHPRGEGQHIAPAKLSSFFLLPQQEQNLLCEQQDYELWDEEQSLDDPGSVQISPAQVVLLVPKGLGDERVQGPVHAHADGEADDI